jgi:hypothetical protein
MDMLKKKIEEFPIIKNYRSQVINFVIYNKHFRILMLE